MTDVVRMNVSDRLRSRFGYGVRTVRAPNGAYYKISVERLSEEEREVLEARDVPETDTCVIEFGDAEEVSDD